MKKILLILIVFIGALKINAQQNSTFGSDAKVMTAEEANKLNGTPQTTINGMPYGQFKTRQDALKKAEENKKAAAAQNQAMDDVKATDLKSQQVSNRAVALKEADITSKSIGAKSGDPAQQTIRLIPGTNIAGPAAGTVPLNNPQKPGQSNKQNPPQLKSNISNIEKKQQP